jgi:two-component system KDP operon response regulator KdpE
VTKEPLILGIEDEPDLRAFLKSTLEGRGYAWAEAPTAEGGISLALSLRPDLVLLDLGLPDRDGMDILTLLGNLAPVVVLSARGREADKVAALEAGADDYLTKPFGPDELLARIKVVLRRAGTPVAAEAEVLTFDDLTWDRSGRRVFLAGEEIHLTPVEYRLFGVLALRPGRILTHSWLLREVWGRESPDLLHYVRIAVAGLRKKLEPHSASTRFLHTEVGVGYRFFERAEP